MTETEFERVRHPLPPLVTTTVEAGGCETGKLFQSADKTLYGRAVLESCRDCHGNPETADKNNVCELAIRGIKALRLLAVQSAERMPGSRSFE